MGEQGLKPLGGETAEYVPGEVLVKFRDDTQKRTVREISGQLRLKAVPMITGEPIYLMKITNGATVETVIDCLRQYPEVEYSEPNYVVEIQ